MSSVSLQALPLRVVPQLQRIVKCRCEDVFSVGREFHKGNWRVVVVDERLQALAARRVPYSTETVVARRHNERSIAVEVNGRDGIRVSGKRFQTLSCSHIPDTYGLVEAAGDNEIALRIEIATEDVIAVAFEGLQTFAAAQLPNLQRLVVTSRD